MYHNNMALSYGDYTKKVLTNRQYVFKREADGEKVLVQLMQMRMSTQRTLIQNVQMHLIL